MPSNFSAISLFSNWWDLNINQLVIELLPMDWRKPINVAYLQALAAPLVKIHYEFRTNRARNIYRLKHNWMRCFIQAALNDEFDPQERRITLDEPETYLNKYIYTEAEAKPKYLGTMYLRTSDEYADTGVDFTVNMHGVSANVYDVRALVDFYRMAGPRYNVINMNQFTISAP